MFALSDNYWKYRRARLAVKRPEFALLDILLFAGAREKGERMSYFERCKSMYQQGQYFTDRSMEMTKNFFLKVKKMLSKPESAFDKSMRLRDKEWDDLDRSEAANGDGVNRSEANLGEDSGPEFRRMNPEAGTDVSRPRGMRDDTKVHFTPDNPENRVASNHVGPERQIRQSNEPFPLAKPDEDKGAQKRDPFAIEDHRSAEEKARKDPEGSKDKDDRPEASGEKKVSSIEDARKKREEKDASEKARKDSEKAAKKRRVDRDDFEL